MNELEVELRGSHRDGRIAVLYGGESAERAVSLATGEAIARALEARGYDVTRFDWRADRLFELESERFRSVFVALHGGVGENGALQGALDILGVRYTGSGVSASSLAMAKARFKALAAGIGVPTAPWHVIPREDAQRALASDGVLVSPIDGPCVVKPTADGSSVGVTLLTDEGTWRGDAYRAALRAALAGAGDPMVEAYVDGREISVGLVDGIVLGTCEIVPDAGQPFYSYEAKYERDDTTYRVPPNLPAEVIALTEARAAEVYRAIGCRGVARVDFIVDAEMEPWLLELNTVPGMTDTSLVPKIAAARGVDFASLCEWLLELS